MKLRCPNCKDWLPDNYPVAALAANPSIVCPLCNYKYCYYFRNIVRRDGRMTVAEEVAASIPNLGERMEPNG